MAGDTGGSRFCSNLEEKGNKFSQRREDQSEDLMKLPSGVFTLILWSQSPN